MREQLIAYFEQQMRYMDSVRTAHAKAIFHDKCFGAIDFAVEVGLIEEDEGIAIWEEWHDKLMSKVYE